MKGKLKNSNLIFRFMCILLTVTSFTCIALAKYISTSENSSKTEIGSIRCSVNVTLGPNDTMIPFFNTQYIINDIVMSYPQSIGFVVNNCDLNEDGTYSAPATADLKYDLIFYIPREFATISAMQIAKKNDANEDVAVTPLYDLEKFLNTTDTTTPLKAEGTFSGTIDIDDGNGVIVTKPVDYGSLVYGNDEEFTLATNAEGTTKQWIDENNNTTITIETTEPKPTKLHYVFPVYNEEPGENTSSLETYAPLYVDKDVNIEFYKITISRPEFVIKGGERRDHNYSFRITTKRPMTGVDEVNIQQDAHFGISFKDFNNMLNGLTVGEHYTMKWDGVDCTVGAPIEVTDDKGNTTTVWKLNNSVPSATPGKTYEGYYIGSFTQKNYPVRLNATFTQTKTLETQPETSQSQTETSGITI